MSKIFFIRHGRCLTHTLKSNDAMLSDNENCLTDLGKSEVENLAISLRKRLHSKVTIISSDLKRAMETAQILGNHWDVSVQDDARLQERHVNIPAGMTMEEFRTYQEKSYLYPDEVFNDSETIRQHRERCGNWLNEFKQSLQQDMTYAVVAHGGTIEHLHALLFHSDFKAMASAYISCDPAHYHEWSVFSVSDGRKVWRLEGVNLAAT